MLHHVGIEIELAEVERAVEFWTLLGFAEVEPPPTLAEFTWRPPRGRRFRPAATPPSWPQSSGKRWSGCARTASRSPRNANTGALPEPSQSPLAATESS